jgi:hypothetical protein
MRPPVDRSFSSDVRLGVADGVALIMGVFQIKNVMMASFP